jgi:UDPglucose 6-dehydrogenase
MIDKIIDLCDGSLRDKTIALLGVTFKPNTDDMRDAPSLTIVPALVGAGAKVRVCDPQGRHEGEALLPGVKWVENPYQAAMGADLLVMLTEWNEFRGLDLGKLARKMTTARLADLRNVFDRNDAIEAGFDAYSGVGR